MTEQTGRAPCCVGFDGAEPVQSTDWNARDRATSRTCARSAESRQSRMLLFLKFAGSAAALYLVLVVLIALLQDRMLFPRWAMGLGPPLPATAERLVVEAASGEQLFGVHMPPAERRGDAVSLVLGFGGNAWNANDLAMHLHSIFPDRDIVAFHYRGYAPSTGTPSARAILDDALTIYDDVVARLAPDRIAVVGLSLGAGPAVRLARSRPIDGVILVTPFDSLAAMAREHYPWLPTRLLLQHHMDVAGELSTLSTPVAVIAAAQDSIVPPDRTAAVRSSARVLVADRIIADAGHNDLYDRADYMRAMQEALSLIEASAQTG